MENHQNRMTMELETRTELRKIAASIRTIDKQLSQYETGFDVEADETDSITDAREGLQAALSALSRFSNKEVEESEPTPEQQYQRMEPKRRDNDTRADQPRTWEVGDLCQTPESERFLVLHVDGDYADVITERGNLLIIRTDDIDGAKHNTGLVYQYVTGDQALFDFEYGYFTPYFEIL